MFPDFQSMVIGSLATAPGFLGYLEVIYCGMKCSRNTFRDPVKRGPGSQVPGRLSTSAHACHHVGNQSWKG